MTTPQSTTAAMPLAYPSTSPDMPTLVLVHGAWHGGWCWQRVLPLLHAQGLAAHAVTLTGVGERAHLLSGQIRLSTHVQDVLGLIDTLELPRVLLVGHSYGGMVITGVADALLARGGQGVANGVHASRVAGLVYVDAVTPHPGESWSSRHTPDTVAARVALAHSQGAGVGIPPPDAAVFGLDGADRDWVNRRQTPQPLGVYQDPLHFDAGAVAALPRTFIDCTDPALPTIAAMRERVRSEPGWLVHELATGHDPMVSAPEALAHLLVQAAAAGVAAA
ncbi:MAG: alpha/beta hydrolase [Burkholderiales bacterium]|nr:alpha/beta hydrolase [Burkholderiales bacterium]